MRGDVTTHHRKNTRRWNVVNGGQTKCIARVASDDATIQRIFTSTSRKQYGQADFIHALFDDFVEREFYKAELIRTVKGCPSLVYNI